MRDKLRYINAILSHLHKQDSAFGPFVTITIPLSPNRTAKTKTRAWRVLASIRPFSFSSRFHPSFESRLLLQRMRLRNTNQQSEGKQGENALISGICFSARYIKQATEAAGHDWLWHHKASDFFCFHLNINNSLYKPPVLLGDISVFEMYFFFFVDMWRNWFNIGQMRDWFSKRFFKLKRKYYCNFWI